MMSPLKQSTLGVLAGAGILLGGAGLAQADQTAPQSLPFGVQQTTGGGADYPPSQVLTFDGFNTALGTLTGVAITLTTSDETNGSTSVSMTGGEGFGPLIDSAWIIRQTNLSAGGPGGLSFIGSMSGSSACSANFSGACSSGDAMTVSTSQNGTQNVISPNLAPYLLSTFDITVAMSPFFDNSSDQIECATTNFGVGTPNCQGSANANWLGDISVVYSYDVASPEPASLALLAASLGTLGMLRRRRR